MKISNLTKLGSLARDMAIPVAIQGVTRSVTVGQLLDASDIGITPFGGVYDNPTAIIYDNKEAPENKHDSSIVWREDKKAFYELVKSIKTQQSFASLIHPALYGKIPDEDLYKDAEGNWSEKRLYVAPDGSLWSIRDGSLRQAGVTEAVFAQIARNTPVRVESEDELERMTEAGECVEGQIYYVAEE